MFSTRERDLGTARLLLAFGGLCGLHRLYLHQPVTAVLYLATAACAGVGYVVDCFTLRTLVRAANDRLMEARLNRGVRDSAVGAPLAPGAAEHNYYGTTPNFYPSAPVTEL